MATIGANTDQIQKGLTAHFEMRPSIFISFINSNRRLKELRRGCPQEQPGFERLPVTQEAERGFESRRSGQFPSLLWVANRRLSFELRPGRQTMQLREPCCSPAFLCDS